MDNSGNGIQTATREGDLSLSKVVTGVSNPTCAKPTTATGTAVTCVK